MPHFQKSKKSRKPSDRAKLISDLELKFSFYADENFPLFRELAHVCLLHASLSDRLSGDRHRKFDKMKTDLLTYSLLAVREKLLNFSFIRSIVEIRCGKFSSCL
jgi:hypothetical protein